MTEALATHRRRTKPDHARGAVIVVAAEKGGVGKTIAASNIAAALGRAGLSVLAIDAEPQGQLALALGAQAHEDDGTVADALACSARDLPTGEHAPLEAFFAEHPLPPTACENGLLLSGDDAITDARDEIYGGGADGELWLDYACQWFAQRFDVVVVDTPPSVSGPLTLGAIIAADLVVTPLLVRVGWSLVSLDKLIGHVAQIPNAPLVRPIATGVDRRLTNWRDMDAAIQSETEPGGYLEAAAHAIASVVPKSRRNGGWLAVIPQDISVEHAGMAGLPIVVGRRSGTLAGIGLRELAHDAYALSTRIIETQEHTK